ncbi:MAG TPA: hypothetical protein VJU84_03785 [Pyrinomonadaceae bacterium]|nr:hypothetical protein [Pyrinomonadaceae bacterium]
MNISTLREFAVVMLLSLVAISANAAPNSSLPRVTAVKGRIEVGQMITVHVDRLSDWSANHDPRKLVPYLNGRALMGIYPEEVNLSENRLLFHLQRTSESTTEWQNLFHEPVMQRPISFSIGLEDQPPFDTVFDYDHRLSLTVIPRTWGIVSLAVVLGMLLLFVFLSIRTNILRAPGPSPAPGKYRPYDVGLVQTAFWFFIVSTSYLCIWLITGDLDTLTPSVLALMGISASTALGTHLKGTDSSTSESASAGFFRDIVSDAGGHCFHRFQIVLWTALLGIIFVASVYDNLAMPQFGGPLLTLMGISAGTYLAFDLLAKRSAPDDLSVGKEVLR